MNSSIFNFEAARSLQRLSRKEKSWAVVITVTFGLILVAGCQFLRVFNRAPIVQKTYRTEAIRALSPQTQVIFSGSSHVELGIDPSRYSMKVMNLCTEGLNYACMETLFEKYLEKVPKVKLAIIELDEVPLFVDTLEYNNGDNHAMYELGLKPWELPFSNFLVKGQMIVRARLDPIFSLPRLTPEIWRYYRLIPHQPASPPVHAGFLPFSKKMSLSANADKRLAQLEKYTNHSPDANIGALTNIIALLQKHGVRVVLLRFPHHPTYRAGRPPRLKNGLSSALATLQTRFPGTLTFWDLDVEPTFKNADYVDCDHLNQFGAQRLAKILNPRLEKLLEQPQSPSFTGVAAPN